MHQLFVYQDIEDKEKRTCLDFERGSRRLLLVGEVHDPLREGVAVRINLFLADKRREHIAGHQQSEIEVSCGRRDEVGVVALVNGFLSIDQFLFNERFDDPAALARGEFQFLPEIALVDAAGLADELEACTVYCLKALSNQGIDR